MGTLEVWKPRWKALMSSPVKWVAEPSLSGCVNSFVIVVFMSTVLLFLNKVGGLSIPELPSISSLPSICNPSSVNLKNTLSGSHN